MNWSFRTRLQLFALVLTTFGVGVLALFFLRLYEADKRQTIFEGERSAARHNVATLANLLSVGKTLAPDRLGSSQQIVLVADGVCSQKAAPAVTVSKVYEGHLKVLELAPTSWANSLDVHMACEKAAAIETQIISFKPRLMVPYFGVLSGDRLVLISMEGFETVAGSTLFMLDEAGKVVWSADTDEFVEQALQDARVPADKLASLAASAQKTGMGGAVEVGVDGLIAFAPFLGTRTLVSLSYVPTLTQAVQYAFIQCLLLAVAVLCLSLILGRSLARLLVRPLDELRASADKIGGGDLDFRFKNLGGDEFSTVKRSINSMAEQISELIEVSKKKANLESELSLTREVQTLLFPKTQVRLQHTQLSSYFDFAEHCGGDWWGYVESKDRQGNPMTVVMIGDVTGHGAPSALMTAAMRGAVSILARWLSAAPALSENPAAMMTLLNQAVYDAGKSSMNMTFLIAVLDPTRQKVYCSNAAHVAGYLIHPANSPVGAAIKPIGKSSITLGDNPATPFSNESYDWYPGSKLFLYTDGLVDVVKGDTNLFDRKILRKAIGAAQAQSSSQLVRQIMDQRARAAKDMPKVDDITVVVCESLGMNNTDIDGVAEANG